MNSHQVRAARHRGGHAGERPGQPIIDVRLEQASDERFTRRPHDDRTPKPQHLIEMLKQQEIMGHRFAKPKPRINQDALRRDPALLGALDGIRQPRRDLTDDIAIARPVLHGPWRASHVHEHHRHTRMSHDRSHRGIATERRHVVDHRRTGLDRATGDLSL